jgi:hypothetical protein
MRADDDNAVDHLQDTYLQRPRDSSRMIARPTIVPLEPGADAPANLWAARITACWRVSVEAILEVGRLLLAAKAALPHGKFGTMIEAELPFGPRTAQMLMAIADDPRLANPKHVSHLPPSWSTLYELTKYSDEQFEAGIRDGKIRPDVERREIINGARAIMSSRQEPAHSLDYSPTPPWATRALVERVFPALNISRASLTTVHEPAAGEGHMAEVLAEYFRTVKASDIHDYKRGDTIQDFLASDFQITADWIITNPPFKEKAEQFALKAIELASVGVAIFARLQWLETIGRYKRLFRDHPPTLIAFFCERVALHMGRWQPEGGTATAYIWLVWLRDRQPRPPIWIPPDPDKTLWRSDDVKRFTAHPVSKTQKLPSDDPNTGAIIQIAVREPATSPVASSDDLSLPTFLRRDHPDCTWRTRSKRS